MAKGPMAPTSTQDAAKTALAKLATRKRTPRGPVPASIIDAQPNPKFDASKYPTIAAPTIAKRTK